MNETKRLLPHLEQAVVEGVYFTMRVVITGAAGLVGQNLIPRLKAQGGFDIVAIDKHSANTPLLRRLHPEITVIEADLAETGDWSKAVEGADAVVVAHAQIGGLMEAEFTRNNVVATRNLLDAIAAQTGCHLVHISSSVVNSAAVDWYTESKKAQERLIIESGNPCVVLRPTLMFGWFDRKHLGWLARFMKRAPLFPVPGNGRYLRQPLYVGDFCDIVIACLKQREIGQFSISGQERINYIDLIRLVREASGAKAPIVKIPYSVFHLILQAYALVNNDPPFTTKQLKALATPDVFEVTDWPKIFGVQSTPLVNAMQETFCDPRFSSVALEF
jgi:nucleoside-diphosphate-sugar epimerase